MLNYISLEVIDDYPGKQALMMKLQQRKKLTSWKPKVAKVIDFDFADNITLLTY